LNFPRKLFSASDSIAAPMGLTVAVAAPGSSTDGLVAAFAIGDENPLRVDAHPAPGSVSTALVDGRLVAVAAVGRDADADGLRTAAAQVARHPEHGGKVTWTLDDRLQLPAAEQAVALVEGTLLGGYDPGRRWKTMTEARMPVTGLTLLTDADVESTARRAALVAGWANRARDLANAPANELTPEKLAERAAEIAASSEHLTAEALGPEQIAELGMGAFAGVAQGSHNPARLVVLRYEPPGASSDVHLGLVGKAITFDTGGISLKPALYMEDMKGDMAGGGAVIESIGALAELGVPLRVLAVVAATENMVGGGSFRPGDILRAANGKTIEIVNTDSEGRLVLADALWYARREGATHLLDLATLTGSMVRALGDFYAGVFGEPAEWRELVVEAGEATGDHAWPWPIHPRYRRYINSAFADMKNHSILLEGGPVLAAAFLQEFAGEGPWAHIDMAGTGFLTRSRGDYLADPGGTGYGVRLIVELAERLARQ
jgi:leucyl aminopeptidase